jgi:hypothetical protein
MRERRVRPADLQACVRLVMDGWVHFEVLSSSFHEGLVLSLG